jgi:excisionase family DNA binding protein
MIDIMDTSNQTMNIQEVAAFCRAEPETIAQYARSGELPGTKMGKGWLFLYDDVIAFLRERIADETRLRREKAQIETLACKPTAMQFSVPSRRRRTSLPRLPISVDQQSSP